MNATRLDERFPTPVAAGLGAVVAAAALWRFLPWVLPMQRLLGFEASVLLGTLFFYGGAVALPLMIGERARVAGLTGWRALAAAMGVGGAVGLALALLVAAGPGALPGGAVAESSALVVFLLLRSGLAYAVWLAARAWGAAPSRELAAALAAYPFLALLAGSLFVTEAVGARTGLGGVVAIEAASTLVDVAFVVILLRVHVLVGDPNPRAGRWALGLAVAATAFLLLGISSPTTFPTAGGGVIRTLGPFGAFAGILAHFALAAGGFGLTLAPSKAS